MENIAKILFSENLAQTEDTVRVYSTICAYLPNYGSVIILAVRAQKTFLMLSDHIGAINTIRRALDVLALKVIFYVFLSQGQKWSTKKRERLTKTRESCFPFLAMMTTLLFLNEEHLYRRPLPSMFHYILLSVRLSPHYILRYGASLNSDLFPGNKLRQHQELTSSPL